MTASPSTAGANFAIPSDYGPRRTRQDGPHVNGWPLLFLFFGTLSICLFYRDLFFPLWLSVVLMALVAFYVMQQYTAKRMGALMALLFLCYLLPFIHIPEYLWYDYDAPEPSFGFGELASNPYMFDPSIIRLTAMLGATGALGIAFGCSLCRIRPVVAPNRVPNHGVHSARSMSMPVWFCWVLAGICLSIISAPRETMFEAAYAATKGFSDAINLSSAWLASYITVNYAFVDALLERDSKKRQLKVGLTFAVAAYLAVWLQLMRGNRECIPWIFALALTYFSTATGYPNIGRAKLRWYMVALGVCGLLLVSVIVGAMRTEVVDTHASDLYSVVVTLWSEGTHGLRNILFGTWSAVLLTPLSVAGDHYNGMLATGWGKDYMNLLLSVPPGFIADSLGYSRPIGVETETGPAWAMRYGLGGTHAVVLPFMNFRMLGVFVVPTLWGFAMNRIESTSLRARSVPSLCLLLTLASVAPHWLWYGEKNLITAVIIWFLLTCLYRIFVPTSRGAFTQAPSCERLISNRTPNTSSVMQRK